MVRLKNRYLLGEIIYESEETVDKDSINHRTLKEVLNRKNK